MIVTSRNCDDLNEKTAVNRCISGLVKVENPPCVKLGVMNCRSVQNKSDLISNHILEYNLDFTALTETWLSPNNQDSSTTASLVPKGYQLHHTARSGCKGGGVGIISKENFHVKQVPSFTATSL